MQLREKLSSLSSRKGSRVILALDVHNDVYAKPMGFRGEARRALMDKATKLLLELEDLIVAAKVGLPLALSTGLDFVEDVIKSFSDRLAFICDFKIADVGFVSELVADAAFSVGFDAVIAHAIVGVADGLKPLVDHARRRGRGVLALCAMSHRGAEEILNPLFDKLLEAALKAGVDGFVLPATFPHYISRARLLCKHALIVSPGVGVQGASFGSAIRAGADYEIVGRAIYDSPSPRGAAEKVVRAIEEVT